MAAWERAAVLWAWERLFVGSAGSLEATKTRKKRLLKGIVRTEVRVWQRRMRPEARGMVKRREREEGLEILLEVLLEARR